jgi:hypothetical protein
MFGMSNGMGVQYWAVRAIIEGELSNALFAEDYGIVGYPTRSKSQKVCMLLVTRWLEGWEPTRGDGLYLAGRWFTYNTYSHEMVPADRPVIYRRYLYGFERLRLGQLEKDQPTPLLWYKDKRQRSLLDPIRQTGKRRPTRWCS